MVLAAVIIPLIVIALVLLVPVCFRCCWNKCKYVKFTYQSYFPLSYTLTHYLLQLTLSHSLSLIHSTFSHPNTTLTHTLSTLNTLNTLTSSYLVLIPLTPQHHYTVLLPYAIINIILVVAEQDVQNAAERDTRKWRTSGWLAMVMWMLKVTLTFMGDYLHLLLLPKFLYIYV